MLKARAAPVQVPPPGQQSFLHVAFLEGGGEGRAEGGEGGREGRGVVVGQPRGIRPLVEGRGRGEGVEAGGGAGERGDLLDFFYFFCICVICLRYLAAWLAGYTYTFVIFERNRKVATSTYE